MAMALYLCRWENGDFSIVQAKNREHAIEMLDEEANAEGLPLYAISDFMAHFRLTDEGIVELEGFGEIFGDHVREHVHPVLAELDVSPHDAPLEDQARIKAAVELERNRLKTEPLPTPETELGKHLMAQMDLPTSVINRYTKVVAREVLRKTKPKGKPS
jgi:hypothetical protein